MLTWQDDGFLLDDGINIFDTIDLPPLNSIKLTSIKIWRFLIGRQCKYLLHY